MYKPQLHKRLFHQWRRLFAKLWFSQFPKVKVIGVTGSYGKTNTVKVIDVVLSSEYKVLSTDTNLDTIYNIPITLLKLRRNHEFLVLEYGVDRQGEMDDHLNLVRPEVAVLTGITPVHTDKEHLGSFENLKREKIKLLEAVGAVGVVIANFDDENVREIIKNQKIKKSKNQKNTKVISYGLSSRVDYQASGVKVTTEGTEMKINYKNMDFLGQDLGSGFFKVKVGLIGKHFAHQALVGTIVGHLFGISDKNICISLASLEPLAGRMSIENGPLGTMVLNDSKRSNPASTKAGLETFVCLQAEIKSRRRIAVLGEMGEINEQLRVREHEKIGEQVANLDKRGKLTDNSHGVSDGFVGGIDYFIGIGPLMKYATESAIAEGMDKKKVFAVDNVYEAAEVLKKIVQVGDWVYLKGSLLRHMERILLLLDDGKKVGCNVVSCPFYHYCGECEYLESGYQNVVSR